MVKGLIRTLGICERLLSNLSVLIVFLCLFSQVWDLTTALEVSQKNSGKVVLPSLLEQQCLASNILILA